MYSVVLLMALSGGADTPAFGFGCKGCNSSCSGCWSCSSSCSCGGGWGCSSSCSSSCHKSRGKSCNGGLFSRMKSCKGCSSSCHSCGGGCHGGCHGGCQGGCHGGYGCCGGGCHGGYVCGGGCHGGAGCHGCTGPAPIPVKPKEKKEEKKTSLEPAPATIVVNLPADAKLTVDGNPTTSTSAQRVFVSPALETGLEYSYTLTAEVVRDGKTETRTEKVAVRAGEETKVEINFATPTVAAK